MRGDKVEATNCSLSSGQLLLLLPLSAGLGAGELQGGVHIPGQHFIHYVSTNIHEVLTGLKRN